MPMSRIVGGLLALAVLACEVSTPPAGKAPAKNPAAPAKAEASPAANPPAGANEPAAPTEPPWSTAAGLAYREVLLGTAEPNDPLPMIVAIHGLGDTPDNFRHLLATFPEPARLILPRGLDATEGGGWSWFPIRARDPDVEALSEGIATAADRIAAGIEDLRKERPTVGKPVVTGFSQGGMLTFTLAVKHPDLVGQAVAVGGWLPPPLVPEKRADGVDYPSIHALHGTTDRAVAYEPTKLAVDTLVERGFDVTLHTYDGVGHMITPPMRQDLYDRITDAIAKEHRRKPAQ
ncbi:MAG: alpha/beta fold hydrolase [Myxococcota bacterium]